VIPFRLLLEPAVFVVSLYLGLVYGIFYLFFESCEFYLPLALDHY
jgi:hypothetical protein